MAKAHKTATKGASRPTAAGLLAALDWARAPAGLPSVKSEIVRLLGADVDAGAVHAELIAWRRHVEDWKRRPRSLTIADVRRAVRALPSAVDLNETHAQKICTWNDGTGKRDRRGDIARLRRGVDKLVEITACPIAMGDAAMAAFQIDRLVAKMRAHDLVATADLARQCLKLIAKARSACPRAARLMTEMETKLAAGGGPGDLFEKVATADKRALQWLYELVLARRPASSRRPTQKAIDPIITAAMGARIGKGTKIGSSGSAPPSIPVDLLDEAWRDARRIARAKRVIERAENPKETSAQPPLISDRDVWLLQIYGGRKKRPSLRYYSDLDDLEP